MRGNAWIVLGRIEFLRGNDAEALKLVLEALDIYRASESGMSFWGPVSLGYLAMFTNDPVQRREALAEAEALLNAGCVSHNHFLFYDLAMEISLQLGAWDEVDRYAEALQAYSQAEPLGRIDFLSLEVAHWLTTDAEIEIKKLLTSCNDSMGMLKKMG